MKSIAVAGICVLSLMMSPALQAQESAVNVVRVRPNLDTEKLQYILATERKQVFERTGLR